jgi:anti-sigma regulatory factor (Ser/Thr protein kinase)
MELTSALLVVADPTDVATARRRTSALASTLGFDETISGRAAIAVTEAATNVLKHAGHGEVFVGVNAGNASGLQVVAMDKGRGIRDIPASLRDGISTTGTAGNGLGAIKRLATTFDLYSIVGAGTVVSAGFYPEHRQVPLVAGLSIPAPGETQCGDAWAVWSAGELMSIFVSDGLGHGREAAAASAAAVSAFLRHAERSAADVITAVHDALKSTRGAAVAIAELDRRRGIVNYCGLGNISAVLVTPGAAEQHLVSLAGIAGHVARRLQPFTYPWLPGQVLLMHSDGVGTHWALSSYPGLAQRQAGVIAGVIARDHRRGSDDATVVVARYGEQG